MDEIYSHGMIAPVLALIGWTFVMLFWLYATRIPAISKAKINPQDAAGKGKLELPYEVTRVADNYNHLHEQPTIFYALALVAQMAGATDTTNITLAWVYVGVRFVHSIAQAAIGIIVLRFLIFSISSLVLLALFVRTVMQVFAVG